MGPAFFPSFLFSSASKHGFRHIVADHLRSDGSALRGASLTYRQNNGRKMETRCPTRGERRVLKPVWHTSRPVGVWWGCRTALLRGRSDGKNPSCWATTSGEKSDSISPMAMRHVLCHDVIGWQEEGRFICRAKGTQEICTQKQRVHGLNNHRLLHFWCTQHGKLRRDPRSTWSRFKPHCARRGHWRWGVVCLLRSLSRVWGWGAIRQPGGAAGPPPAVARWIGRGPAAPSWHGGEARPSQRGWAAGGYCMGGGAATTTPPGLTP